MKGTRPRFDGPCKNCTKRTTGCHSLCKDYIDAKNAYVKRMIVYMEHNPFYDGYEEVSDPRSGISHTELKRLREGRIHADKV